MNIFAARVSYFWPGRQYDCMAQLAITLIELVDTLRQHYGPPAPPPSTDPLELIIWSELRCFDDPQLTTGEVETARRVQPQA